MNRFLLTAIIFAVLPFSASAADAPIKLDPPKMEEMVKLETYESAKQLPEVTLAQQDGGLTYLSSNKGKIVVLNIWATWCPPCVKELPSLNALQTAMGGDTFQVVTVSLDKGEEGLKNTKKFMDDNKLEALVPYVDSYEQMTKLEALKDVPGIPVTLILDQRMRVLARYQGDADWNGRAARAVIEYYLKNTDYNPYEGLIGNTRSPYY